MVTRGGVTWWSAPGGGDRMGSLPEGWFPPFSAKCQNFFKKNLDAKIDTKEARAPPKHIYWHPILSQMHPAIPQSLGGESSGAIFKSFLQHKIIVQCSEGGGWMDPHPDSFQSNSVDPFNPTAESNSFQMPSAKLEG